MRGEPLRQARNAATSIVSRLGPVDRAAIVVFSDEVRVEESLAQDRIALREAVARIQEEDRGTALYDAVTESARLVGASGEARRAVLFLSDGREAGGASTSSRTQSLEAAAASGALFYVVGLGNDVDDAYLQELAARTQGRYVRAPAAADVPNIFASLEDLLRSHFVVTLRSGAAATLQERSLQLRFTQGDARGTTEYRYQSHRPAPAEPTGAPFSLWAAAPVALLLSGGFLLARRRRKHAADAAPMGATDAHIPTRAQTRVGHSPAAVVVTRGSADSGEAFAVGDVPLRVGSGADCPIRLPDEPAIAPEHARIWLRGDRLMVHHVAAGYDTVQGGERVVWASLRDGEEIGIGPFRLRCALSAPTS
jgi:LPXTG-motif cell wall-anchored protein